MIRTVYKIYLLFIGVSLLMGTPLTAQKLYKQFEKEKYSKILEALETESPNSISDSGDLKACATVALWNGDFELASSYYEKLEKSGSDNMTSEDYFNYAYALLETGQDDKLMSLTEGDEWVKQMQGIVQFRENIALNDSFIIEKVDLRNFLYQYGISYCDEEVYYSSSEYDYSENNNLENSKLSRRWAEFAVLKHFGIDEVDNDSIVGDLLVAPKKSKRVRFATARKDTVSDNSFYTFVPLKGKPERIIVKGDFPKFPYNSKKYACAMPWYDEVNSKLYFCSDMSGGMGGWDVYSSELKDDEWKEPVNEKDLNTPLDDIFPHSSPWGIVFASNARKGLGGFDNYLYSTDSSKVCNLVEFNSDLDDYCLEFVLKDDTLVAVGVRDTLVYAFKYLDTPEDSGDVLSMDDPKVKYGDNDDAYLLPSNVPEEEEEPQDTVVDAVPETIELDLSLYYGMDKHLLTDYNKAKIDTFLHHLHKMGKSEMTLVIKGSADGVGKIRYNDYISYQRATTVVQYIKEQSPDINFAYRIVVMGQLADEERDSCALRKSKVLVDDALVSDAPMLYRYVTESGQTILEIADLFNNDVDELRALNKLTGTSVPSDVLVGIKTVLRVKKGKTLYIISQEHGCSVEDLIMINKKRSDQVREKEVLVIPIENKQ